MSDYDATPDPEARTAQSASQPGSSRESQALKVTGRSGFVGAMFLMAVSAIGPGFLTQTATFTLQLGAAFAFAILVSVMVDIAVQLNVWRIIGVSGRRAQDLANSAVPGSGYVLSGLDVFGGLVFNIGNIAGCTLGLHALFGLDVRIGAAVSAAFAIAVFLVRRAGWAMDRIMIVMGIAMLCLTTYVAITSKPPVGDALLQSVAPETISWLAIATLIGGTVGGYIVYAGAHRMVDNGVRGVEQVGEITRASVMGILITAVMRVVLFLAVLGVVSAGASIDESNPVASAFTAALGDVGRIFFGTVMWIAAVTSVIGCSYTSTSFVKVLGQWVTDYERWVVVGFIVLSTSIFIALGTQPVNLLVFAGAFNALILPFGLGILLWVAWRRRDLLGGYVYPRWLLVIGTLAWIAAFGVGVPAVKSLLEFMGWAWW